MLDIRYIRENSQHVKAICRQKGYLDADVDHVVQLDQERRELQLKADSLRAERNVIAATMKTGKPQPEAIAHGKAIKTTLAEVEERLRVIEQEFLVALKKIPNIPLPDVPIGTKEEDNQVVKTVGTLPSFDFTPKTHAEIAQMNGWLDKERAAKVTGSRFAYLKGDLVRLQFALVHYIIDTLSDQQFIDDLIIEHALQVSNRPFVPILPPLLLRTDIYDAMDRLEPRDDRYKIEDEDLWLQGSAEHVLGSMHAGELFEAADLPLRYIGYATSFRREAGTYGKDMEGMFRMHQFDKLEMESLTSATAGEAEHHFLVAVQEKIMQLLELPYRVIMKSTFDIGKPNARGVDIEAWLPGQNAYRETHTADYMTDYQARRLKMRLKTSPETISLIHTNDATALPLSRGPIAIIENYQNSDGTVRVPTVLRPYLSGRTVLAS